ncbi:MAG: peptide chain release factor N(5)-glutamine methyltransferase [Fimbriimonadaceae bacterium]
MRVADWIQKTEALLAEAGIVAARTEAQILAAEAAGKDRTWAVTHPEAEIDPAAADPLRERRLAREPLAYILGRREFFGREFRVTPDVLIPRHETECVVEAALDWVPADRARVLDLGTGSGCIGISLALERPGWSVTVSDVSPNAIRIAEENAGRLGARVLPTLSDLFDDLPTGPFDAIVTNPPYVEDGARLEPEVGRFEPAVALFAGADGLNVYRRIAEEAGGHLAPGGILIAEVGDGQATAVGRIFAESGWNLVEQRTDLGGTARVLVFSPSA